MRSKKLTGEGGKRQKKVREGGPLTKQPTDPQKNQELGPTLERACDDGGGGARSALLM